MTPIPKRIESTPDFRTVSACWLRLPTAALQDLAGRDSFNSFAYSVQSQLIGRGILLLLATLGRVRGA